MRGNLLSEEQPIPDRFVRAASKQPRNDRWKGGSFMRLCFPLRSSAPSESSAVKSLVAALCRVRNKEIIND
jgi:hypothetical protein